MKDTNKKLAARDVYGETLVRLGKENQDIVVLDADLSCSTRTCKFAAKYPERFFNMGIAEQDMISTAAGLAACGKIPFVSTFAIFETGRCWDQIRQSICYSEQNVKLVATHAGITVGEDSATHQANEDIALMRVLPKMKVIVPADGYETEAVIEVIVKYRGPVYVRLSRSASPIIFKPAHKFEIGKSQIVHDGDDVTIIAIGIMVSKAINAAAILQEKGIFARVINMSTIKPIDKNAIIDAAKETSAIVTAEEHSIIGGLGSAVSEVVSETIPVPIKRVGVKDRFGMSGNPDELLRRFGLNEEAIIEAVEDVMSRKIK